MKVVSLTLCLCAAFSLALAQPRQPHPAKQGPLRLSSPFAATPATTAQDTLRVLALMVEFKSDIDSRTSGNGTFMSSGSQNQIDPPPHDSLYVANKLRFLSNYYKRVSNGLLTVRADVFSPVVVLSDSMSAYSPVRAGSDSPLGDLIVDSWTAANTANPSFPFSLYDAFLIIHAGIGRDINVVSILGLDPTPYDLPSLFVDLSSLRDLLNDPGYAGVPVNGGAFHIANSIILPETETRVFGSGGQTDTLQLSINGMLAASLGSFLGLPDLFDTKTGRSGIGQFGLMDGAAIFAYNGLFPPEPSAWEKIRLGWASPVVMTNPSQTVTLPAVGLTTSGQDSILKIPITATEYFLVENRSRDPLGNGQTLTVVQGGSDVTLFFAKDTTGFFFNNVSGIKGSLVDAEDFDWAISGDMTQPRYEGGGILIWHIDETIINANLATNTVNADPLRRGVDLEEADGSQDIGQIYEILDPGSGTESGWPPDMWYGENPAPVYRNAFDASSFPNSKSNSGALSFVAVSNFGARAPRMSLDIRVGTSDVVRIDGLNRNLAPSVAANPPAVIPTAIILSSDDSVFVLQKNGLSKTANPDGLLSSTGGRFPLASVEGTKTYVAGAEDSTLFLWDLDTTTAGVSPSVTLATAALGSQVTTSPMFLDSLGTQLVAVGKANGSVSVVQLDGLIRRSVAVGASSVKGLLANPASPGTFFALTGDSVVLGTAVAALPHSSMGWKIAGGSIPGGFIVAAAEQGGRRIVALNGSLTSRLFDAQVAEDTIRDIIVADVDNDGRNDVVVTAGSSVYAYNEGGVLLDHFPYRLTDGGKCSGSPVVADVDGDGLRDVLIRSTSGVAVAFGSGGRMIAGFPFQIAPPGSGSLTLFETSSGKTGILSVNGSGNIAGWERNLAYDLQQGDWRGYLSDASHGNFNVGPSAIIGIPASGFLPKERVYNWPNPVYGSSTNIRFFTTEPARIVIKIFDLAGESVTQLTGNSPGGIDSEIVWDVSGIQSGIYFAHVEASAGPRTDAVIFKIAVVK